MLDIVSNYSIFRVYLAMYMMYVNIKCHIFVAFLLTFLKFGESRNCIGNGACSCTYDDGSGVVDITSLAGPNGQPRLKDTWDSIQQYKYSYNPCRAFSEGTCSNVAVCELTPSGSTYFYIAGGRQEKAQFSETGGQLKVVYKTNAGEFDYTTTVALYCDLDVTDAPKFEIKGATTFNTIDLKMTHACLCAGACNEEGLILLEGLSLGSILCIIFLVVLIVYFGLGALFLIFVKKETWSKAVPNGTFWIALPGYIKDGALFVYGTVRRKPAGEYEKL